MREVKLWFRCALFFALMDGAMSHAQSNCGPVLLRLHSLQQIADHEKSSVSATRIVDADRQNIPLADKALSHGELKKLAIERAKKNGLWDVITDRGYDRIAKLYNSQIVTTKNGAEVNLEQFIDSQIQAVVKGESSILSLGEGRSSFVSDIIKKRKLNDARVGSGSEIGNIHAVDASYPKLLNNGEITDGRLPSSDNVVGLDRYDSEALKMIRENPENYHSQMFQGLDLRSPAGSRRRFNLIISNYSLGYVLNPDMTNDATMRQIVTKVLDHLEPGGTLVIMPIRAKENYFQFLAELKSKGVISDYSHDGSLRHIVRK